MSALRSLMDRLGTLFGGADRGDWADQVRRLLVLVGVCTCCALFVVDYARAPNDALHAGDIAPRTVKAPFEFTYADHAAHEQSRGAARDSVRPVYVYRVDLLADRDARIRDAFAAGRDQLADYVPGLERALAPATAPDIPPLTEEIKLVVMQAFLEPLRIQLPERDLEALLAGGFSTDAESLARRLLDGAMRDNLIVLSRSQLPPKRQPVSLIRLSQGERNESVLSDLDSFAVPEEVRQAITLEVLGSGHDPSKGELEPGPEADAAAQLARSLVTANVTFDALQTEERREAAAKAVPLQLERVQRGQTIFRAGQVVTEPDLDVYRALQEHQEDQDLPREIAAIGLFLLLLLGSLYQFTSTHLQGFSTRVRDVLAAGVLLVFVAFMARLVVASSEPIAELVGYEAEARSVWFLVPVAGAAMLVRLLLGVAWSVAFAVAAAAVCGLVMDLHALPVIFFMISGVAAASAVEHTRERIAVLRAGAVVGVVNAVTVLMIHFVQLFVVEGEISLATTMRPFWSMSFAFVGAIFSAFLVLGLVPLMEWFGFVTDYRLMELANLNHPLLRQLMLRAPGSYHHSVVVGTLAEAGCEAIGANSLLAKVASYFHDIGKAVKPQYFVENQRGHVSAHQALSPQASAQIIISHVTDGGRMARERNLPQPILDNIYMHHGTGLLQYFYNAAREQADNPDDVDESAFRYPGPKPSTREAGVIMLADKVEAATRTLKNPDEHHIRAMIHRIVNSVIADGQFSECPLNLQEIHQITQTFVQVLQGIYHQRIEYAETADISSSTAAGEPPPREATITLDLVPEPAASPGEADAPTSPSPAAAARRVAVVPAEPEDAVDYEAVDYLPRGD